MSGAQGERRKYHRVAFRAAVSVTASGGAGRWATRIRDISLKGVLFEEPEGWPADAELCEIELPLGEENRIRMTGRVVRRFRGLMGFEWANIDIDSLIDLRRLLELNLGSEELIDRDLSNLFTAASD